ncbi:MAG: ATP synthase subunit C [Chromatiales bacterium]|nr:ATP synthase subunit C [Chromatiales bacterium]
MLHPLPARRAAAPFEPLPPPLRHPTSPETRHEIRHSLDARARRARPSLPAAVATLALLAAAPRAAPPRRPAAVPADPSVLRWGFARPRGLRGAGRARRRLRGGARSAPPRVGALAEKPELFGRVLIIVGLAEGIAIYGLIVSILILNRLG